MKTIFKNQIKPGKLLMRASSKVMYSYDPWEGSVVLLTEMESEGSIGFIINQPTMLSINSALEDFPDIKSEVFMGGPVGDDTIHYIHQQPNLPGCKEIAKGIYWGGDIDIFKKWIQKGIMTPKDVKFMAGYTGWSPGQLEEEVNQKEWSILNSTQEIVFTPHPLTMYTDLIYSKEFQKDILHDIPIPSLN